MTKTLRLAVAILLVAIGGCSKQQEKEEEPVLPVQLTDAQRDSIEVIKSETLRARLTE